MQSKYYYAWLDFRSSMRGYFWETVAAFLCAAAGFVVFAIIATLVQFLLDAPIWW